MRGSCQPDARSRRELRPRFIRAATGAISCKSILTPAPMKFEPSVKGSRDQPAYNRLSRRWTTQVLGCRRSFVSKCQALVPVDQARSPNKITMFRLR
jgi:hypothetical protein